MNIESKLMKQIPETKYLTAENCWRYRAILRYFYNQYEAIRYWMYKEDVYEALRQSAYFQGYTIEQCQQDMEMLTQWGNLLPMQDTTRAATIEEFKNKQFRYQMTEYAVEIERMTVRLENLFVEGASLEPTLLERIRDACMKFGHMAESEPKEVGGWWRDLNTDFKRLNQNYQDYVRGFYSQKAEDLMKTRAFIVYKDTLVDYLRDFVKGLQKNAGAIEQAIRNAPETQIAQILDKAVAYEQSIPRLDAEVQEEAVRANARAKWESLRDWFAGAIDRESEASRIYDITNDIIRKITRFASQIAENRSSSANRKEEYKKLCTMFINCSGVKEAHMLSSLSFGIFGTRHLRLDGERLTESATVSVYDEPPEYITITPAVRGYRERSSRPPIRFQTEKKEKLRNEHIRRLEEEKRVTEAYIQDGVIDMELLPPLPKHVRITLLKWIARATSEPSLRAKTEDGRHFRLIRPEGDRRFVLHCEDGDLHMPAYKLHFGSHE